MKHLIIVLLLLGGLAARAARAATCEDFIQQLDPKANPKSPIVKIGALNFQIFSPAKNPTSSCSISVKTVDDKRFYGFMDDGSVTVQTQVAHTGAYSKDVKTHSMMLLPQEKGKNFGVRREGNMVFVVMNGGEFKFDTISGKLIPSETIHAQETATGIEISEPQALLVDFGTLLGKNPKEQSGLTTWVRNRSSTCQVNKAQLLEMGGYDKNIRYLSAAEQVEFFKKSCVGTRFDIKSASKSAVMAPAKKSKFEELFGNGYQIPEGAR